jgi:hypothetical protein
MIARESGRTEELNENLRGILRTGQCHSTQRLISNAQLPDPIAWGDARRRCNEEMKMNTCEGDWMCPEDVAGKIVSRKFDVSVWRIDGEESKLWMSQI